MQITPFIVAVRWCLTLVLLGFYVGSWANQSADNSPEILPAQAVFIPTVTHVGDNSIDIRIDIQPGYYLYRKRLFGVAVTDDRIRITDTALSAGQLKTDAYFGEQSVWIGGQTPAALTVQYDNPQGLRSAELRLRYQGCQDGVICYPPQTVTLPVTFPEAALGATQPLFGQNTRPASTQASAALTNAPKPLFAPVDSSQPKLLSENDAFAFSIDAQDATTLNLHWRIADGYYLYRDKLIITATDNTAPTADSPLADIRFAAGKSHTDEFFGEQTIYRGNIMAANLYLQRPVKDLTLDIQFQGCADIGVCYPVMRRTVTVENGFISAITTQAANTDSGGTSAIDKLTDTLRHNLWAGVGLLLLAGIALAFTPCVLPMLPILLGIITNQRKESKARAAMLSSAYALGVAVMMAVFGLVVAKTGINIQIIFQKPLWLMAFAAIFIVMGLAMLGVFSIAMPNSIQSRVIGWQNRFQNASPAHVFVVGALSTLVVGPCIAPPLIATLAFISTTNDSTLGAVYLFSLGLGMSLPLVIFATLSAGIPRTGAFSRLVTRVFAMLMFGVGLWLLGRLLPGTANLALWGTFFIALGGIFWRNDWVLQAAKRLSQGFAALAFAIGGAWLTGAAMGNSNPLKPFTTVTQLPFIYVNDSAELANALRQSDKPILLDLYADWCVSCQEVEHITFADPEIAEKLNADFTLLKLDITDTTAAHQALLRELNLIGPPALLFFDGQTEQQNERYIGAIKVPALREKLRRLTKPTK